jgi:hypothetical protein
LPMIDQPSSETETGPAPDPETEVPAPLGIFAPTDAALGGGGVGGGKQGIGGGPVKLSVPD